MQHLKKNPKLARTVADLTGDGHLQIDKWRYLASFYSKNLEEIKAVKQRFFDLFEIEGRIYVDDSTSKKSPNSTRRYKLFIISKPICVFLKEIGTPVGNKTNNSFVVPEWVFNGTPEIQSSYLRGLFDNEGSIHITRGKKLRWRISFRMAKNSLLIDSGIRYFEQLRSMLAKFGVKSSPVRHFKLNTRKDGSRSRCLHIDIEKSSFRNFFKYVGFEHPIKQQRLINALNSSADGQAAKAHKRPRQEAATL